MIDDRLQLNLDEKLLLILKAVGDDYFFEGGEYDEKEYKDRIAQIKQAFADEGYIQKFSDEHYQAANEALTNSERLYTGQEWYDRFEKEAPGSTEPHVFEAARRAAGLDQ